MKQTLMSALLDLVNAFPAGVDRDRLQANINIVSQRARDMPGRVAAQAPFADAAEKRAIEIAELDRVLAGWQVGCEQIAPRKS